jgi:hypothetical protein
VRSILLRPDSPAIIVLGHFSPQVQQQNGFAGPDTWHSVVAQYYDVPHVSTKSALYGPYMVSPASTQQYYADPILANAAGHGVLADVLAAYVQSQVCVAWAAIQGAGAAALPVYYALGGGPEQVKQPTDARKLFGGAGLRKGEDAAVAGAADASADADADAEERRAAPAPAALAAHFRVPAARIATRPEDMRTRVLEEVAPFCVSANDLVNPLPPSLFYGSGWHAHHPPGGTAGTAHSAAHYWYSTLPTSRLRIGVNVAGGDVGVYYIREPQAVLGAEGGSAITCWVDDNEAGSVTVSNVGGGDEEPT